MCWIEALGLTAEEHWASLGLHAAAGQAGVKMGPRISRTATSDGPWLCALAWHQLDLMPTPRRKKLPLEPGPKAGARA